MENRTTEPKAYYLEFNDKLKGYLRNGATWGKFIAIVGYVGIGFMSVISIAMIVFAPFMNKIQGGQLGTISLIAMGAVYIIMAILYYFPVSFLYRYSVRVIKAVNADDQMMLESSFRNLNNLFRFIGVITIIMLSIIALYLLIMIPTFIVMSSTMS